MNYYFVSACFLFFLGLIWNGKDWPNFILKTIMISMSFWGGWMFLVSSGYVLHK